MLGPPQPPRPLGADSDVSDSPQSVVGPAVEYSPGQSPARVQRHDDNDDVPTNIYLTKLPLTARNEDLAELVAGDGDSVLEVRVLKHPTSGQGRGQAFVKYTTAAGAKAAVLRYDGAPFMGNVLSVSPAFDSNRGVCAEFAPSGRVFIRGIPRHVTHSDLVDLISPMATVHGCTMHVDRVAGQPLEEATSKFAYIVVSDQNTAATVVSHLHQRTPWPTPGAVPLLARIAPRRHRDAHAPAPLSLSRRQHDRYRRPSDSALLSATPAVPAVPAVPSLPGYQYVAPLSMPPSAIPMPQHPGSTPFVMPYHQPGAAALPAQGFAPAPGQQMQAVPHCPPGAVMVPTMYPMGVTYAAAQGEALPPPTVMMPPPFALQQHPQYMPQQMPTAGNAQPHPLYLPPAPPPP